MKPTLRSLRKGQEVWAVVEENLARDEVLINFNGDLVRVQNKTERIFRVGQRVLLQVRSVEPLKFSLITRLSQHRASSAIDLSI